MPHSETLTAILHQQQSQEQEVPFLTTIIKDFKNFLNRTNADKPRVFALINPKSVFNGDYFGFFNRFFSGVRQICGEDNLYALSLLPGQTIDSILKAKQLLNGRTYLILLPYREEKAAIEYCLFSVDLEALYELSRDKKAPDKTPQQIQAKYA